MERKYQVFISSTYEDLKTERQAAISCLLDLNCIPVGMEQFPASSLSQWEYIKKMIDMSDYYLLIVAGKYGSIDSEGNNLFREKKKLPSLPFCDTINRLWNVQIVRESIPDRRRCRLRTALTGRLRQGTRTGEWPAGPFFMWIRTEAESASNLEVNT